MHRAKHPFASRGTRRRKHPVAELQGSQPPWTSVHEGGALTVTAGGSGGGSNANATFDEENASKGKSHRCCRHETRPASRARAQAVERVTKPCGRKVAGRQSPRGPDLVRWMCPREQEPMEGAGVERHWLASSGQDLGGRRNSMRGALAETKPSANDGRLGKPPAGPKGQRQRGIAEPISAIPAGRTEL
jgi:hypothetical protein